MALKIIKPGMDTQQVIARFEAERQALAMMDHPNIARVLDAGTTEQGRPYFVMELVKGVPITEYCDEQQLTFAERLELFIHVCNAVQHAHQKGIIHRDIKPSNVLVTEYDGEPVPKVIDFGVAKATSRRLTQKTMFTEYGQIVGTIEYMSPEQAQLNQLDIDTRSDIYSLGVLLYELLVGDTPFGRQRLRNAAFDELLRIIREEEPPRPSLHLSSCNTLPAIAACRHTEPKKLSMIVRGDLDWIAMKALEKERARRYDSPSSLAADVARFLAGQPVYAHPPSAIYRLRKFAYRYRVLVATALTVLFAIILGTLGTTTGWARASALNRDLVHTNGQLVTARAKAEQEARRAEYAQRMAVAEAERQRQLAYIGDMEVAHKAWHSGDLQRLEDLLRRYVPNDAEHDLRGFEWFYLWRLWKGASYHAVTLPTGSEFWCWLALSADGSRMAVAHPRGEDAVTLVDVNGMTRLDSFGRGTDKWLGVGVAISADGKMVAYRSRRPPEDPSPGGSIVIRNVETGEERLIETPHDSAVVAFSPNLPTLAIGYSDGTIELWDLPPWQRTGVLQGHEEQVNAMAFSPDGKHLASASKDRTVKVWDVEQKTKIWGGERKRGQSAQCGIFTRWKNACHGRERPTGRGLGCIDGRAAANSSWIARRSIALSHSPPTKSFWPPVAVKESFGYGNCRDSLHIESSADTWGCTR